MKSIKFLNQRNLVISAIIVLTIVLLFKEAQILIISVFLFILVIKHQEVSEYENYFANQEKIPRESVRSINKIRLFLAITLVGLIFGELTELFAVLSNLHLPPEERILFLPDPILDLLVAIAYYLPIMIVVAIFLVKFQIDLKFIFILGGIYGVITEQNGAILLSLNFIFWIYVFLVYGSFISIPYVIFAGKLSNITLKRKNKVFVFVLFLVSMLFAFFILARVFMALFFIGLNIPF
ncbi:MAG: hypothetical protein ACTSRZ_03210 [Promethearchaeota archaeon]